MCVGDAYTAASNHPRVHNASSRPFKFRSRTKKCPSGALFWVFLKSKATTNEDKEGSNVIDGLRMGFANAETAASDHTRV